MEQREKIKTIMDICNVNEASAIRALDACKWDVVEAIVYLKNNPDIGAEQPATQYTAQNAETPKYDTEKNKQSMSDQIFGSKFLLLDKNNKITSIPLLLVIVLLFLKPKFTLVVLAALMVFRHRFAVSGFSGEDAVNKVLNSVNAFADKVTDFIYKKN